MRRFPFVALLFFALTASLVAQSNPVPFLNQPLVPSAVAPGGPAFMLTLNGSGFTPASVGNWNGTPLVTTFLSVTKLVATVPAANIASNGTAKVTVTTPAPGGGSSNVVLFTVTNSTSSLAFKTVTLDGIDSPSAVIAADFNNDVKGDMAVISQSPEPTCNYSRAGVGSIVVLLGNSDGTFTKTSTLCFPDFMGELPLHLALAADYNADGNADIIAESGIHGGYVSIFVYYGNGNGTFSALSAIFGPPIPAPEGVQRPETLTQVCLPDCVWGFTVGDFDGNGQVGSAVTYTEPAYGFASLTLLPEQKVLKGRIGSGPASLGAGDLNGDGKLDLATLFSPGLFVFLNDGDGTFTEVPGPAFDDVRSPMTIGDFTGDGILDLAIGDDQSTALTVLRGNGDGTFTQVDGQPGLPQFSNSLTTADVNGDGILDLVWSGSNTISVLLGNGDGTFHAGFIQGLPDTPSEVVVADFDGDGRLDLALTNSTDNTVSILLQTLTPPPGRSITLVSDQNPAYVNQPVTYSAIVVAHPTPPTGSVTFTRGATALGTVVLVNGVAQLTTTYEKAGTFSVYANYSGDQNYRPKTSQTVKQVVNRYASDSFVQSSLDPSVYGQAINLTCFVSSDAPIPPTGTVTFRNGLSWLGSVPLVDGLAILTKKNLPAGSLSITATYNGDILHNKSSSGLTQVVSQATTTTTVTVSPNPSIVGQNVTFKAVVLSPTVVPVGTVTFAAGTTTLGTVSLSSGKASLTTSALPAGATTVTATYNGTANISGSSGTVVQKVH